MPKHALLVTRSAPIGIKVLYCLSMAGWRVSIAVDGAPSLLRWSRYIAGTLELPDINQTDRVTLADSIDDYCTRKRVSVILGDAIGAAGLLHELRPLLRTPTYAPEPSRRLQRIHNKWAFYQQLRDSFPMPRTALLNSVRDLNANVVDWVGRPFLLKPLNGEAGHGIRRFDGCEDAVRYQKAPGKYRSFPLLIQQYIQGRDFGYSVISDKGNVIIDDVQSWGSDDVRMFCCDEQVRTLCREIIAKLNYSGPAFIDLRRDEQSGRFYPLECNCRFWSTMTANAWMGINYPNIAVYMALGIEFKVDPGQLAVYHLPGTIARYFVRPWNFLQISRRNWLGFFQAISDPLPHVLSALHYDS